MNTNDENVFYILHIQLIQNEKATDLGQIEAAHNAFLQFLHNEFKVGAKSPELSTEEQELLKQNMVTIEYSKALQDES
jgi:hypothetical protein